MTFKASQALLCDVPKPRQIPGTAQQRRWCSGRDRLQSSGCQGQLGQLMVLIIICVEHIRQGIESFHASVLSQILLFNQMVVGEVGRIRLESQEVENRMGFLPPGVGNLVM